jgi:hypothetical protein
MNEQGFVIDTHIISGDEDLRVLHLFQGIAIVSPADFLKQGEDEPKL